MNFNPLSIYINTRYSRIGDSMESLGRDCFFVKIVEMLGCLGELMYICNLLDSIWLWQENYIL